MKFFSKEHRIEPGFSRGLKEITDLNKMIGFIEDNVYNNFSEITPEDIVEVAANYKIINQMLKKTLKKDTKILNEILEILIFKVEVDKSIPWSPENISNFFLFLKDQPKHLDSFHEKTVSEVLELGIFTCSTFPLDKLGEFTQSISFLCPEQHLTVWSKLIEKFQGQSEFNYMTVKSLISIFNGIFSHKDEALLASICESSNFLSFFEELEKKLRLASISEITKTNIFDFINCPTFEIRNRLSELLAEKLFSNISVLYNIGNYMKFDQIVDILTIINQFDSKRFEKRELFQELNNKIIIGMMTEKNSILTNSNFDHVKAIFIKYFLSLSKDLDFYHITLIDQMVLALYREQNNKHFRMNPTILADCISHLAYLNYPGRFTGKISHKEISWKAWQSLIEKYEDTLLTVFNMPLAEDITLINQTLSQRNISYLWGLCVFNIYSMGLIQALLQPKNINPEENYNEEDMKKLFQIHYWLTIENNSLIEIEESLLSSMKKFKENFDTNFVSWPKSSELKQAIKLTLQEKNFDFKENFSDFPYQFDYSHSHKKFGIVIEDESKFLGGTDMQIQNGFYKVMNRQLVSLGWFVQKISLRSWLSFDPSDLLPKN